MSDQTTNTQQSILSTIKRKYNVSPVPSGSMALGLNIPEAGADYDFAVPVESKKKFESLVQRMSKTLQSSPHNVPGTDYHVFKTNINGEDVDIAVLYGDKGKAQRAALLSAKLRLNASTRKKIVDKKREIKNSWFFPETRYKRYKRTIDTQLGLPRFSREKLASDTLLRSDVYAHRTHDITPILKSGRLLSAAQAAERGLIKEIESNNPFTRKRQDATSGHDFREEIFVTQKLLPATETYGKYGVLFRSRKAEASRYINKIPTEHVIRDAQAKKLTFVVPDAEIQTWKRKYPEQQFLRESSVPSGKKLDTAHSWTVLAQRLLNRPKFRQDTRKVVLAAPRDTKNTPNT